MERTTTLDNNRCQFADEHDPRPWCYTTNSQRWDYCDQAKCKPASFVCGKRDETLTKDLDDLEDLR